MNHSLSMFISNHNNKIDKLDHKYRCNKKLKNTKKIQIKRNKEADKTKEKLQTNTEAVRCAHTQPTDISQSLLNVHRFQVNRFWDLSQTPDRPPTTLDQIRQNKLRYVISYWMWKKIWSTKMWNGQICGEWHSENTEYRVMEYIMHYKRKSSQIITQVSHNAQKHNNACTYNKE